MVWHMSMSGSLLKVIWLECGFKSLELILTISVSLMLFICYFTKEAYEGKHVRGIELVPIDATCWVSWGEGIKTPYLTGSYWRLLSIAFFCLFGLLFCFKGPSLADWFLHLLILMFCLFWTYTWSIQWKWFLYVHVLRGLLLCNNNN